MAQALPFLCGPAALIQLLNWRGSSIANSLGNQIRIWRAANTVYMGRGPAGCDAAGLLRAADGLGERLDLIRMRPGFSFDRTVRTPKQAAIIRMVEQENLEFARSAGRMHQVSSMKQALETIAGKPVLIMCSMRAYSMSNEYHWLTCRPKGAAAELYDPSAGQYESRLKMDFFESFDRAGISNTFSLYSKYIIEIIY